MDSRYTTLLREVHVEFEDIANRDGIRKDNCDVEPGPAQSLPRRTVEGVPSPVRVGERRPILIADIEEGAPNIAGSPSTINTDPESDIDGFVASPPRVDAASAEETPVIIRDADPIPTGGAALSARNAEDESELPTVGMDGENLDVGPNEGCDEDLDESDSLLRGFLRWVYLFHDIADSYTLGSLYGECWEESLELVYCVVVV